MSSASVLLFDSRRREGGLLKGVPEFAERVGRRPLVRGRPPSIARILAGCARRPSRRRAGRAGRRADGGHPTRGRCQGNARSGPVAARSAHELARRATRRRVGATETTRGLCCAMRGRSRTPRGRLRPTCGAATQAPSTARPRPRTTPRRERGARLAHPRDDTARGRAPRRAASRA